MKAFAVATSACKHPKFSPSSSTYISCVIAYHCMHSAYHFIAQHSIACHYISSSRSNTPVFKIFNPDLSFKTFLSKINFKTWVFNQHCVICQPPRPYILKYFLRKQSGFISNSISIDFNSQMRPI